MIKGTKDLVLIAVYSVLLIGGQLALSAVSGVEIVTVLLICFCLAMGISRGLMVAWSFSLLRCLLFGFFPTVIILYLTYYSLFATVFGVLGNIFKHKITIKKLFLIVTVAILMTILFTVFDNVITPLFYGFTANATKAYWTMSIYTLIPHIVSTLVTVSVLTVPILKQLKT